MNNKNVHHKQGVLMKSPCLCMDNINYQYFCLHKHHPFQYITHQNKCTTMHYVLQAFCPMQFLSCSKLPHYFDLFHNTVLHPLIQKSASFYNFCRKQCSCHQLKFIRLYIGPAQVCIISINTFHNILKCIHSVLPFPLYFCRPVSCEEML